MADEGVKAEQAEPHYAVVAEVEGYPTQLVLLGLPFGRLMDEVIVPYDTDQPFFIDGVPVTKQKIRRVKILQLTDAYKEGMREIERGLTRSEPANKKTYGEQYTTRFEHVLRTTTVDVTAQVIKAYVQVIKPSVKNYLPKREELIGAAAKVFVEAMKSLGS
jgi:hypothetical protein